jgi:hypothetical protein
MKTTQGTVSGPVVQRYVDRLLSGETPPAIKTDGDVIVDGNHRYVAGRLVGKEPPTQPGTLSPSQKPLVKPVQKIKVDSADYGNN